MICPNCSSSITHVLDTRSYPLYTRRRRECSSCSYRFSTLESIERKLLDNPESLLNLISHLKSELQKAIDELNLHLPSNSSSSSTSSKE